MDYSSLLMVALLMREKGVMSLFKVMPPSIVLIDQEDLYQPT